MGGAAPLIPILGIVLLTVSHSFAVRNDDSNRPAMKRLVDDLFSKYDRRILPVSKPKNTIEVKTGVDPLYLTDLNEAKQVMTLQAWLIARWKDELLTWNPNDYEGLKTLRIPCNEIWLPDISVYNSIPTSNIYPWTNTRALIYSDGNIIWVPPASISVFCASSSNDGSTHVCNITLGSWTYDGFTVNLSVEPIRMSDFKNSNPRWEVIDTDVVREKKFYPCCEEPYPTVTTIFTLRRRSEMCVVHWVAPLLTLAMFWVPATSCLKLTVGSLALLIQLGLVVCKMFALTSFGSSNLKVSVLSVNTVTGVITMAILLEIFVLTLANSSSMMRPPAVLMRLLSSSRSRIICLRDEEHNKPGIQEKDIVEETSVRREWFLLATAADRILFLLFGLIFIIFCCLL